MSKIANPAPVAQRFIPANRESFFDAQRRNRRATWRLSALCALSAVIMGIPLALPLASIVFLGAFIPLIGALISGLLAVVVAPIGRG